MGDQPEDIYLRVKNMIMKYIKGEEKVILCIIPANGPDFSTAEGVLLARAVDPQQRRTLGVITKVDRAEAGIRARLLAEEESDLKLSLGFIAVRNRTQEEVAAREPLSRVRAKEAAFFQGHAELSSLVGTDVLGMACLERRLVAIQADAIKAALPRIKRKVAEQKTKVMNELKGASAVRRKSGRVLCAARLTLCVHTPRHAQRGDDRAGERAAVQRAAEQRAAHVQRRRGGRLPSSQRSLQRLAARGAQQAPRRAARLRGVHQVPGRLWRGHARLSVRQALRTHGGALARSARTQRTCGILPRARSHVAPRAQRLAARRWPTFCRRPSFPAATQSRCMARCRRPRRRWWTRCAPTSRAFSRVRVGVSGALQGNRLTRTRFLTALVEHEFGAWPRAAALVKSHVNELLDDGQAAASHLVQGLCEQQRHIFTLNPFYMDTVAKFKRTVADIRDAASAPPPQPQGMQMRMPDPLGLGAAFGAVQPPPAKPETSWLGRVPKDLLDIADEAFLTKAARATSGEEIGIREMQLSLKVYSKVVMRRVGDDVPLSVLEHMVMAVGESLAVSVQRKAQGTQLAPLLQDDPTTVARRQRLERSLVNLSAAWVRARAH